MSSYEAVSVIGGAIENSVARAGIVRLHLLPDSSEEFTLAIVDALEAAGYRIVRNGGEAGLPPNSA